MEKKVILITGASSGLGQALAELLVGRGYQVFGTSRNPRSEALPYRMLRMDVTDAAGVASAIDTLIQEAGRLDVLINNAGIGMAGPTEELQLENVQQVIDTNFYGTLRTIQAALPHLRATRGRIINISSVGAAFGLPFRGIYSASKSAVGLLTEALRMEVATTGVQACTVLAGDIQTPISDHRIKDYRPGNPLYAPIFERIYAHIDEEVARGLPAAEVARRIAPLLETRRLKPHYIVAKPLQKLSVYLNRLLPKRWFEALLRRYSGT